VVIEGLIEVGTGLTINEHSWIASNASFLKHEHRPEGGGQFCRTVENTISHPTEIGPYAMVGVKARVLPHTFYIGKGATIGHSSVVARSVGDYAIAAGNPARVRRYNVELAERIEEENAAEETDRTDGLPDLLKFIADDLSSRQQIVIVGAKRADTILSAARSFKHVLAVDCCKNQVVALLRRLENERLRNACLQCGTASLIHELDHRRPFTLAWLYEDGISPSIEASVFQVAALHGEAVLTRSRGEPPAVLAAAQFTPIDIKRESTDYAVFCPATAGLPQSLKGRVKTLG
jgi:carbonic anhydrase/acetyltransferase-like protein (isoleucine patch superfamily)